MLVMREMVCMQVADWGQCLGRGERQLIHRHMLTYICDDSKGKPLKIAF